MINRKVDISKLKKLAVEESMCVIEIAHELKVTWQKVKVECKNANIPLVGIKDRLRLLATDYTTAEIAEKMGSSYRSTQIELSNYGIKAVPDHMRWSEDVKKQILKLLKSATPLNIIEEELGQPKAAIKIYAESVKAPISINGNNLNKFLSNNLSRPSNQQQKSIIERAKELGWTEEELKGLQSKMDNCNSKSDPADPNFQNKVFSEFISSTEPEHIRIINISNKFSIDTGIIQGIINVRMLQAKKEILREKRRR